MSFFEEVRTVWRQELGLDAKWKFPITVNLEAGIPPRRGMAAQLTAVHGDGGTLAFFLLVWEPSLLGKPELAAWGFQALAAELAARTTPPELNKPVRLAPEWFVQGLVSKWEARRTPGSADLQQAALDTLFASPRPPTVAGLVRQKTFSPENAELPIFRLLAAGLLDALAGLPEGRGGLRQLAAGLNTQGMELDAILKAFPSLGDINALERHWTLSLARRAMARRTQLLSFEETWKELSILWELSSELPARGGAEPLAGPLAMLGIARERGGPLRLGRLAAELMALEARAHPLFAPIVAEFRQTAQILALRPKARVRKRIEDALALAGNIRTLGESVKETLLLAEANLPSPSPNRHSPRRPTRAATSAWQPEPRTDAITLALDAFEQKHRTSFRRD